MNPWDQIERGLLLALQTPRTTRQITAETGFTADTVKAQLDLLVRDGLAITAVDGGIHHQITIAGRRRLQGLPQTLHNDRQAA